MSLRICLACTTRYAISLHACPHCGSHAGTVDDSEPAPKPKAKPTKRASRTTPRRGKTSR